jgi:hypothetical protein
MRYHERIVIRVYPADFIFSLTIQEGLQQEGVCVCRRNGQLVSDTRVTPGRGGVTSSSQAPPLEEEEAPFQNWQVLERIKIWSWVPTGPEIPGLSVMASGQQQFARPTERPAQA